MNLNNLLKTTVRSKKVLGRGIGSGRGKTSGRGTKGQKARGKIPLGFIGGTLPLYKKMPYRRGLGNRKISSKPIIVNLDRLSALPDGAEINVENLIAYKVVNPKTAPKLGVKIGGKGDVTRALKVCVATTIAAAEKIKKAGGILKSV